MPTVVDVRVTRESIYEAVQDADGNISETYDPGEMIVEYDDGTVGYVGRHIDADTELAHELAAIPWLIAHGGPINASS